MNLKEAQAALEMMMRGGIFNFSNNLDIISEQAYNNLINRIDPVAYEIAFNQDEGTKHEINIIEKCQIDVNPQNNMTDMVRKERTYEYRDYRIFQMECNTVPLLVITGNPEDQDQKELVTTFWLNKSGKVVHYRVAYNGTTIEDVGKFNPKPTTPKE
jgi:hypothetical protein